jgi:uncharacterized membrane protein YgcG
MTRRYLHLLTAALTLWFGAVATDPSTLNASVVTSVGVLSQDDVTSLAQTITSRLASGPTMPCGAANRSFQFAFVILRVLDGPWTTQSSASHLLNRWGVGYAPCDNGAVLVVAVSNRSMYLAYGAGAAAQLPDSKVQSVFAEAAPALRSEDFAGASGTLVSGVLDLLVGGSAGGDGSSGHSWQLGLIVIASVFGLWCCMHAACRRKVVKVHPVSHAVWMAAHSAPPNRADGHEIDSCTVCLDDFTKSGSFVLPCGHPFHRTCIEHWFAHNRQRTCPLCRAPAPMSSSSAAVPVARWDAQAADFQQARYRSMQTADDWFFVPVVYPSSFWNNNNTDTTAGGHDFNSGGFDSGGADFGGGGDVGGGGSGGDW